MTIFDSVHPVLMSSDVAASVRFYELLGFACTFRDHPINPRYAAVRRDRVELHLQWADEDQWAYPIDRPNYRFPIPGVDALYDELRGGAASNVIKAGAGPWSAPGNTPWGTREFHLRDPDGNGLHFYWSASPDPGSK